jgi:hypothetical protein
MILLSVVVHRDEVGAAACPMAETGNDAGVKHGGAGRQCALRTCRCALGMSRADLECSLFLIPNLSAG